MNDKPLSNFDIYKLFDGNIKIIKYSQLYNYDSIQQLFGNYTIVFILYEISNDFGHWVVLCWDKQRNKIIFFDPYGVFPDDQLDNTSSKYNGKYPILSTFLIDFPGKVEYNRYPLQDINNKNVATCGRWCSLFALLSNDISLDEFADIFLDSNHYPDDIISLLTHFA